MPGLPDPLETLIRALLRWPGIGPRSAQRIAFHLAREEDGELRALGGLISGLPDSLGSCSRCSNFSEGDLCPICLDVRRDDATLCVVEQPDNLAAIERSGAYRGVYQVLGGSISPLRGVGPEDLRIETLLERLSEGKIRELILATNPTVEGEATALFIARKAAPFAVSITRPATGLPVGGELDYVDKGTLARAFEGRQQVPDD